MAEYAPFEHTQLFGSTSTFNFAFKYILTSHVSVFKDGALLTPDRDYFFPSEDILELVVALQGGENLRIERNTPYTERMVKYTDGAQVTDDNLDISNNQHLFANNEATHIAGVGRVLLADVTQVSPVSQILVQVPAWTTTYRRVELEFEDIQSGTGGGSNVEIQVLDGAGTMPNSSWESVSVINYGNPATAAGIILPTGPSNNPGDGYSGTMEFVYLPEEDQLRGRGGFIFQFVSLTLFTDITSCTESAIDFTEGHGFIIVCSTSTITGRVRVYGIV